jgi:hypothetical protein
LPLTAGIGAPFTLSMVGRDFVLALERHGFVIKRRSRSFVWVSRGEQTLMLDEDASVPDGFLARLLGTSTSPPPSVAPRQSSVPTTRPGSRMSSRPATPRPTTRPTRRP